MDEEQLNAMAKAAVVSSIVEILPHSMKPSQAYDRMMTSGGVPSEYLYAEFRHLRSMELHKIMDRMRKSILSELEDLRDVAPEPEDTVAVYHTHPKMGAPAEPVEIIRVNPRVKAGLKSYPYNGKVFPSWLSSQYDAYIVVPKA